MNRDPLYRTIVGALQGPLDGNTFERCAAALIGKAHPNLSPMPGGNDAGMDGAFGTPDGRFPLICTVQSDVIGNFRKNISTYLAKRNGPRRAVVATSQHITNPKKRNLEDEAEALGVTIVNIYDADYFADQLYRDAKWRLELLGIPGDPPALSKLPRVGRFAKPELLVGREDDLKWLEQLQGDGLLVGQPGSGKTYLHQYMAAQDLCLFAVDGSQQRLADAIREQQPSVIVVDDAHTCLRLVEDLDRLRAELGTSYYVHLNCWPRYEDTVRRILRIPQSRVRQLQPLRKPEIFKIIEELGIRGPDWLQHLLISQSDGKPGLAVALAEACRSEDVRRIWSGEAAAQQLLGDLGLVQGERERCVLAAFAVGGDTGMSFHHVSDYLDISVLELREITASLGSGGLVQEMSEDRLQVRPPTIRAVLVRDVFFRGPTALKIDALLDKVNSLASTATVLLSARQRGAEIDESLLERFVTAAGSYDVWGHFAWVDARCANVVLDRYPEKVCHAAPGLLNHSPHRALNVLLDADDADRVPQGAAEHPHRQISEWLFPIDESPHVTIDRRRILLDVLEERARSNRVGKGQSFTWALAEILQARFDVTTPSPGSNRIIRCRRGVASPAVLGEIGSLWPRIKELFRYVPNAAARAFFDRLQDWCIPQRLSIASEVPEETCEMVRSHARRILSDILDMPHCNRAWRTRAATMAKWGELDLQIEVDPTFDALHADRDFTENWEQEQRNRLSELDVLANELIKRPLEETLQYLADIRLEAIEFGYREGSGYLWAVYHQMAQRCDKPIEWLDALIRRSAPSDFLAPFLDRLSVSDSIQHEAVLGRLLERSDYQSLAIGRILLLQPPNDTLLSSTLGLLGDRNPVGQFRLHDERIAPEVIIRLLTHPDSRVRAAAAVGEWQRNRDGTIRPELESQWRIAILDADSSCYALTEVFAKMPTLAFEWLRSQIQNGSRHFFSDDPTLRAVDRYLSKDQRAELLRLFTCKNYSDDCFDLVLGQHTELFADWLNYQSDEYIRLCPLDRYVGPRWEQMALLALDAGVSPKELADHCWPNPWDSGAQALIERIPAYEALANHPDPRLRPAGERRLRIIRAEAQRELEQERREETYGD